MTGTADAVMTNGSCMCGGVRFHVTGPIRNVLQCHCARCRKFTGNFTAASGALSCDISFESDKTLQWFNPADDANVGFGFCATCGSSLFWKLADAEDGYWSIHAGAFDNAVGLSTAAIWYADHAAEYTALDPTPPHINAADL
ncbi:MAG: hypothetical protein ACI91Q_001411 [Gammaproteobacteria bacterium]|jgi:hypothetical protein